MNKYTNDVVPPYDFAEALSLSVGERIRQSLAAARRLLASSDYQSFCDYPCIPSDGGTEAEIQQLERDNGANLPPEYREFLTICRYLILVDGCEVGGLDHNGVYYAEHPWVSDQHRVGDLFLVIANYWRYADGDQLLIDLKDESHPVIVYLHEHGPLFEAYAPSFSLALWRLVHELD